VNMSNNLELQVTVCVCTYKRPLLLLSLLESLAAQTYSLKDFEVVVVDNDALSTARQTVEAFTSVKPRLTLRYSVEPMQGIAHARNRSVSMAKGTLLAFIDDDEIAEPKWLTDLVACMRSHAVDAVIGPVISRYTQDTPRWVIQSRFFERKRFPTGSEIGWGNGHTGNALVKTSWAKQRQPHTFDLRLARSGGEDTDFFRWLESLGGKSTWCDSAVVSEEVPPDRQTVKFMLTRSLISSVTYWRPHYAIQSRGWCYRHASLGLIKGFALAILGVLKLPFGKGHAVSTWAESAKALGRIAALSKIELIGYGSK
jgi:glycosyltransferase involved in cell wall biosynthesis